MKSIYLLGLNQSIFHRKVIYKVKPKEILNLVVKSYRQQLNENEIKA